MNTVVLVLRNLAGPFYGGEGKLRYFPGPDCPCYSYPRKHSSISYTPNQDHSDNYLDAVAVGFLRAGSCEASSPIV